MPPWYVDKTVGIQQFANDRSLTDHEIDLIARWVDAGAPQGNPRDLPAAKVWPTEDVWEFADYFGRPPDLVVKSPDYTMPAVSQDRWWEVRGTPAIPEDRWVAGTETRPVRRSRKVVHHATTMLFQKETAETARFPPIGAQRQGRRRRCCTRATRQRIRPRCWIRRRPAQAFSEWAVGKNGELYVEHDAGQFLRAGSEIGWDIHLNASGEETPVEVETAFWFYPKGTLPKFRAMMSAFGYAKAYEIDIPPGQVSRIEAYTTLPAPAIVLNFQPHMHFRGKAFTMEAIYPDGRTEVLNSVPQYRFNWHINYVYTKDAAPVLPEGDDHQDHRVARQHAGEQVQPRSESVGDLRPAERRRNGPRQRGRRLHHRGRLRADHRGAEESGRHQHAAATAVAASGACGVDDCRRRRRRAIPQPHSTDLPARSAFNPKRQGGDTYEVTARRSST